MRLSISITDYTLPDGPAGWLAPDVAPAVGAVPDVAGATLAPGAQAPTTNASNVRLKTRMPGPRTT